MDQIILNFDSSEFDGFETCRAYLQWRSMNLIDDKGRRVLQKAVAADLDYSPSQWSQKICESGDARVTLNDAEMYADKFGDVSWIHFLVHRHIISKGRNREALLKLQEQINKQLAECGE